MKWARDEAHIHVQILFYSYHSQIERLWCKYKYDYKSTSRIQCKQSNHKWTCDALHATRFTHRWTQQPCSNQNNWRISLGDINDQFSLLFRLDSVQQITVKTKKNWYKKELGELTSYEDDYSHTDLSGLELSWLKMSSGRLWGALSMLMNWGFALVFISRCLSSSSRVIWTATGDFLCWATSVCLPAEVNKKYESS